MASKRPPAAIIKRSLILAREYFAHTLAFLQRWLDRLELDPEKHSLRGLLSTINVVLVLLVIAGISASAIGLLRSLANAQGMTRVQLAGASARDRISARSRMSGAACWTVSTSWRSAFSRSSSCLSYCHLMLLNCRQKRLEFLGP